MLTIGQLAAYAGVTVRAVRHYHQIGLLPEPERDSSGYRSYDAAAVVRLIRIRTLAEAGVPLSRVQELLDAAPEEFAAAVDQIDQELRAEVRRLQEHRRRIARLAAGDSLALPRSVVDYLDRLREKAPRQRVRVDREDFVERIEGEPARLDAVVALQDGARHAMGARVEAREPVGSLEGCQALRLGVAGCRRRRADASEVHV